MKYQTLLRSTDRHCIKAACYGIVLMCHNVPTIGEVAELKNEITNQLKIKL